jgi:hypothetical protein
MSEITADSIVRVLRSAERSQAQTITILARVETLMAALVEGQRPDHKACVEILTAARTIRGDQEAARDGTRALLQVLGG